MIQRVIKTMNINNLTFLNPQAGVEEAGASTSNVKGGSQGMSEEFLALLSQEINPENPDADIMAILKSMPVEDVNQLVKSLSEEVNAKKTGQDQIVVDLLSQFDSKESLVKAMEENPKLVDMVKNANHKLLSENPALQKFLKNNEEQIMPNKEVSILNSNDDFVQMKNQMNKKSPMNLNINAFKDQSNIQNINQSMIQVKPELGLESLSEVEGLDLPPTDIVVSENNSEKNETILSMKLDTTNIKANDLNLTKVLDINSIQNIENTDEMITKIQDYIVQSKVSGEKSVEMSFMHKELGQINVQVEKINANQIQVSIMSTSSEGAKFFRENQNLLSASLASSGLDVSQIKLESSSASSSNLEFEHKDGGAGDFAKENEQRQNSKDHKRRHELWQALSEEQVA